MKEILLAIHDDMQGDGQPTLTTPLQALYETQVDITSL